MVVMKEIRKNIIELARSHDLSAYTYRKLGEMLGGEHPYQVQYHIKQLVKSGDLLENKRTGSITAADHQNVDTPHLIRIPLMGSASCGTAVELAADEHQGFVHVSPSLLGARRHGSLFALRAHGDSMNTANINGNTIENGDFIIVNKAEWGEARDGDYVVSLMGDYANVKRLRVDKEHSRLILMPESTEMYTPIIIAQEDLPYYRIMGTVVDVVKSIPQH